MLLLTIAFGIATLIGAALTLYYGVKSRWLERNRYRFTWHDVASGSQLIGSQGIKKFRPDAVVAFSGPAAVIAALAMTLANRLLPFFILIITDRDPKNRPLFDHHWTTLETTRWLIAVPKALLEHPSQRILLVDDCVISGDSMQTVLTLLVENGFQRKEIRTCSFVCSKTAADRKKAPDFCCFESELSSYYLPWGKVF